MLKIIKTRGIEWSWRVKPTWWFVTCVRSVAYYVNVMLITALRIGHHSIPVRLVYVALRKKGSVSCMLANWGCNHGLKVGKTCSQRSDLCKWAEGSRVAAALFASSPLVSIPFLHFLPYFAHLVVPVPLYSCPLLPRTSLPLVFHHCFNGGPPSVCTIFCATFLPVRGIDPSLAPASVHV